MTAEEKKKLKCFYCDGAKKGEPLYKEVSLGVYNPACIFCFMSIIDKEHIGDVGDTITKEMEELEWL